MNDNNKNNNNNVDNNDDVDNDDDDNYGKKLVHAELERVERV